MRLLPRAFQNLFARIKIGMGYLTLKLDFIGGNVDAKSVFHALLKPVWCIRDAATNILTQQRQT